MNKNTIHACIHQLSTAYLGPGCGDSNLSSDTHISLSPATSFSSGGTPRHILYPGASLGPHPGDAQLKSPQLAHSRGVAALLRAPPE